RRCPLCDQKHHSRAGHLADLPRYPDDLPGGRGCLRGGPAGFRRDRGSPRAGRASLPGDLVYLQHDLAYLLYDLDELRCGLATVPSNQRRRLSKHLGCYYFDFDHCPRISLMPCLTPVQFNETNWIPGFPPANLDRMLAVVTGLPVLTP